MIALGVVKELLMNNGKVMVYLFILMFASIIHLFKSIISLSNISSNCKSLCYDLFYLKYWFLEDVPKLHYVLAQLYCCSIKFLLKSCVM